MRHVRVIDESYGYFSPNAHTEKYAGLAQLVSASALQAGGQWFEPTIPYQHPRVSSHGWQERQRPWGKQQIQL